MRRVDVGDATTLLRDGRVRVVVPPHDIPMVVARVKSQLVVFQDHCPHRGRSLLDAQVTRSHIRCAAHGRRYPLMPLAPHGKATGPMPAVPTYQGRIEDGRIVLTLPDALTPPAHCGGATLAQPPTAADAG